MPQETYWRPSKLQSDMGTKHTASQRYHNFVQNPLCRRAQIASNSSRSDFRAIKTCGFDCWHNFASDIVVRHCFSYLLTAKLDANVTCLSTEKISVLRQVVLQRVNEALGRKGLKRELIMCPILFFYCQNINGVWNSKLRFLRSVLHNLGTVGKP